MMREGTADKKDKLSVVVSGDENLKEIRYTGSLYRGTWIQVWALGEKKKGPYVFLPVGFQT